MSRDSNVLLVVLDSVRYANTNPTHEVTTVAKLRRRLREHGGVRYTGARAPSIWSYPSHISLFTGSPAGAHRVNSTETTLDPTTETLFERLGNQGYTTGLFSTNPFLASAEWNLQAGFDRTNPGFDAGASNDGRSLARRVIAGRSEAKTVCEAADRWISDTNGRWAVCINLMEAHSPYVPVRGHNVGRWRDLIRARRRGYGHGERENFRRTSQQFRAMERLYDGCIHQADTAVAWLIDRLAERGTLTNVHAVITSDHGEGFGEPNEVDGSPVSFHWNAVNEQTLHVPLYECPPGGGSGLSTRDGLSSPTQLWSVLFDDGEFAVDQCTVEQLYGGNVTADTDWTGGVARVLYERTRDGVRKYITDPRGTVAVDLTGADDRAYDPSALDIDAATIQHRVETAFEALPSPQCRLEKTVDDPVRDRLHHIGYT